MSRPGDTYIEAAKKAKHLERECAVKALEPTLSQNYGPEYWRREQLRHAERAVERFAKGVELNVQFARRDEPQVMQEAA